MITIYLWLRSIRISKLKFMGSPRKPCLTFICGYVPSEQAMINRFYGRPVVRTNFNHRKSKTCLIYIKSDCIPSETSYDQTFLWKTGSLHSMRT